MKYSILIPLIALLASCETLTDGPNKSGVVLGVYKPVPAGTPDSKFGAFRSLAPADLVKVEGDK